MDIIDILGPCRYIATGEISLVDSWIKPPSGTIFEEVDRKKNILRIVSFPPEFTENNPMNNSFLNKEVTLFNASWANLEVCSS